MARARAGDQRVRQLGLPPVAVDNTMSTEIVRALFFACVCVLVSAVTFDCDGNCIRKCCEAGQHFVDASCVASSNDPFHPLSMPVYTEDNMTQINISDSHFRIVYGDPCGGNGKFYLDPSEVAEDEYYLLEDGRLYTPKLNRTHDSSQYCLEAIGDTMFPFVCFTETTQESSETTTNFRWYPVGMIVSLPCLLATVLVYCILLELRTLHGRSLISYASTLFIGYLSLAIVQVKDTSDDKLSTEYCVFLAFVIQFSFLASFFWLNIMCFDIWWVFSGLRPLRGSVKEREHKKFIIYSAYAWGCPFIIFIISVVMDYVKMIPDTFIKPHFGVSKCWFHKDDATLLYFYLPIGILVLLNIIMFVTTAYRLKIHTRETQVLKGGDSKRHDESERQRFNLYLKLFIVMGINWVMELVSFFLQGPKYVWFVTDLGNTLQGVLIFLIFVWKRRILRLLNHKLCPKLQLVPATSTTSRSKVSPSRTTTTSINKLSSINSDSVCLKKLPTSDDSDAPP